MEEVTSKHNLKIYIDNVFCDPTEDVSCPRSLIIAYGIQVVTLINHNLIGAPNLEVNLYVIYAHLILYHILNSEKFTKIKQFKLYNHKSLYFNFF